MSVYRDADEFMNILSTLWNRIFATPEIMDSMGEVKLMVKFRFTDFKTELYIDSTGDTPKLFWNPDTETPFDVEMIQSSDTSHLFWMQDLNVPMAIATRKVVAKGSVQKALKLIPALKPAFALYPVVLKELGREDLASAAKGARKRKKRKKWFPFGSKSRQFNPDLLPKPPIHVVRPGPAEAPKKRTLAAQRPVTDVDLLITMLTIRAFEQHLAADFKAGNIPSEAIHLSIGQEAVAAGVCLNLRDSDYLNTTHRGHGHIIAKGANLNRMMAELYGKADGLCGGLGGSMHVTDGARGVLGANGIVGAGYLLALGAGFTIKHYHRTDDISVVIAGDGSVNQGMFHEAMNLISTLELPVLVVVENNLYGEFTSVERHSGEPEMYKRAAAYRVDSRRIDGNDARTVFREIGATIKEMRDDGKPRLVEVMTYRWHGHMEGDPEAYRTEDEKERFKQADPITLLEQQLTGEGTFDEKRLANIKQDVAEEIKQAVTFAANSPLPAEATLLDHIYSPEEASLYECAFDCGPAAIQEMSVSGAINRAIEEEMKRDDKVFLWGEDVSLGGYFNVTSGLIEKFGPNRIIDTPISENAIVGGAVGAAMTGMRPVCEILFADFLSCCMDPILNQAAKIRFMTGGQASVPLTIRAPVGSGIGMAAQHSQSMERFFYGIPGLIVLALSEAYTAVGLTKSAIRSDNPVLIFEHKLLYAEAGKVPTEEYMLPLGKARVVKNGDDVTIVTYLLGLSIARQAADLLEQSGISAEIIDLSTLYPMDDATILQSIQKTGHLVTLEEALFSGSVGSDVIARVSVAGFDLLKKAPVKIAAPDCPIPYAKNLETAMIPTPDLVADRIEDLLS